MDKPLRVGIVGGSIAGCAMAVELSRIGCQVTVFERSRDELFERGAGIATPRPVFESWLQRDLVDAQFEHALSEHVVRVTKSAADSGAGRVLWKQPSRAVLLRWGALFQQLRARVLSGCYMRGVSVTDLLARDACVSLQLEHGARHEVDLAVFCDGYRSLARQRLFPAAALEYSGCVLWRGVLPARALHDPTPLEGCVVTALYPAGQGVFYFVPQATDDTCARSLNWALYFRVAAPELSQWLTDASGVTRAGLVPAGFLPADREHALKQRAKTLLPAYFADIVEQTNDTFLQALFDGQVPSYRNGLVALSGDAGALALPTSASGALKAIQDAVDLAEALKANPSLTAALSAWEETRTRANNFLVDYGRQIARVFITDELDWTTLDAAGLQRRLAAIVTAYNAPLAAGQTYAASRASSS